MIVFERGLWKAWPTVFPIMLFSRRVQSESADSYCILEEAGSYLFTKRRKTRKEEEKMFGSEFSQALAMLPLDSGSFLR